MIGASSSMTTKSRVMDSELPEASTHVYVRVYFPLTRSLKGLSPQDVVMVLEFEVSHLSWQPTPGSTSCAPAAERCWMVSRPLSVSSGFVLSCTLTTRDFSSAQL